MKHALRGFTLIELLTAIMVLGVLFAMAIPSFREMTRSNRIAAGQNDLITALTLARSEALRRSTTVSVCASTTGTTCVGVSGGPTNWTPGWIAFTDTATAGTLDGTDDEILQKWGALTGDTQITGSASYLTYTTTGMLTAARSFDVFYTACTGANARKVDIALIGLVTPTKSNCP
jgi:type IV fimbrial biogenesis protein FimT